MSYDFQPFYDVISALGTTLVPLAIPALVTWLVFSFISDLLFKA